MFKAIFGGVRPQTPGGSADGRQDPGSHDETREVLARLDHDDDRHTITHFSRLLSRHGRTHAALEWNSRESQERRFGVLSEVGLRSGDSVLDVGCGTGDLVAWLDRHGLSVRYRGIDMTPLMVETARERFPDRDFVQGCLLSDLVPLTDADRFDWVVASGIFAHRRDRPDTYMRTMIQAMLKRADKGVAVNSLSLKAPYSYKWTLYHADPDAMLEWAGDHAAKVVLREDYDPNDFTLYLYVSPAAARQMTWSR